MLDGLTGLVQYLIPQRKDVDGILRSREMEGVKQYCERQGFGFYPEEAVRLPAFAREVNLFIEERARRDLPTEQFQNRLNLRDLSKWVEIGGIIGYNGHLFEMNYSEPNSHNVSLRVKLPTGVTVSQDIWTQIYGGRPEDASVIASLTSAKGVSREDLDRAKYVVDWHTHHVGFGELSEGDAEHMKCALEKFGKTKPIYSVVFRPAMNQSVWYQAKKAQSK